MGLKNTIVGTNTTINSIIIIFKKLGNNVSNFSVWILSISFEISSSGLLIASLDDESQNDLRLNKNFNTYKGAIYENIMAEELVKSGFNLFFYKTIKPSMEIDFIVRDSNSIVPLEIKASDNQPVSLIKMIDDNYYNEVKYGIKLCNKNIGFNGKFYTFPYFLTFLLKRYLKENK